MLWHYQRVIAITITVANRLRKWGRVHEQAWVELGKIDYFLEHLARAVERGEVHRDSYDRLAPRYLERRAELVQLIEGGHARAAAPQPSIEPVATPQPAPAVAPVAAPVAAPRRERTPMSWTTVLVVTGAFLVIVATAIFALATWELFGPVFQVGFLATLTAAFYAGGMLVRRRLGSSAGGVALIVVASAMLLFDGWLLISALGLSGPWPWAVWLLICSAAYWFTEVKLTGGIFGVAGAAAQIAWWWLLGEGLGWDPLPRLAGIAVVAVAWAWAAERGRETPATAKLASILRYAAPVTVGLTAFAGFMLLLDGTPTGLKVLSVIVIAWSGTAIAELLTLRRELGALAHAPLVLMALSVLTQGADGWSVGVLLLLATLAAAVYAVIRGGALYGLMAPVLGAAATAEIGIMFWLSIGPRTAFVAMCAALWPVASRVLKSQKAKLPTWMTGAGEAESALHASGIIVLGLATIVLLPVIEAIPLTSMWWALADTITVAFVVLAWAIATFGGRSAAGAVGLVGSSFLLLAAVLETSNVGWEAALVAIPFLVLALAWVLAGSTIERYTKLPSELLHNAMRFLTLVVVGIGLAADAVALTDMHWSAGMLLWAAAAWWVVDRMIAHEAFSLAPVAAFGTLGAAAFGWWWGVPADGAVAAAVFALAGTVLAWVLRKHAGMGDVFAWALVAIATAMAALAVDSASALALALGLTAAAGAVAVASSGWREGAVAPVVLGTGALLAALNYWNLAPWVTVVALGGMGFACLVPALLRSDEQAGDARRLDRTLAISGLIPLAAGVLIGFGASVDVGLARWAQVDGHLFAMMLLLVGVYVLAAATRYRLEPAFYLGAGVILFALFAELAALDVEWVEFYSTPAALYLAWCGYRWSGSAASRRVPILSDISATAVALGVPFIAMLNPWIPVLDSWVHTFVVVGFAIAAIVLGVMLRVRGYFVGGIVGLVLVALVRSWDVLVLWWWLVLGGVGTGMIVIALARELREGMASVMRDLMTGWR